MIAKALSLEPMLGSHADCQSRQTMYGAGRANLAAHWFFTLGFTCPYGVNVADFILDVASGAVTSSKLETDAAANHLIACSERCAISSFLQASTNVS